MTTAKRRGSEAEIWPVEYAHSLGLAADHIRQQGDSKPDIKVTTAGGRLYVVQCKARRNLSITRVLREAQDQADNYARAMGIDVPPAVLLVRPYGMGRMSIGQWPLIQTFEQFLTS